MHHQQVRRDPGEAERARSGAVYQLSISVQWPSQ